MTLNSSGPISLGGSTAGQSINLELGKSATATVSLNDTDVRTLAGVASGAIVMPTNFYGKSSVVISITDQNISSFSVYPDVAETVYSIGGPLGQDGKVYEITTYSGYSELEQWCTPTSEASNYEVFATIVSGSLTSGPTGSWVALNFTRQWSVSEDIPGNSQICTFTVQIRKIGTTTVLDTATITIEAGVL